MAFAVAPLCKQHRRDTFRCGEEALDRWLAEYAVQQQDKGLSRTFVLLDEDRPDILAGFYSLTADALSPDTFPEAFSRRYPGQYPIPAIRLVRLARNIVLKGQDVGELLLVDALSRMVSASDQVGVAVIVVDAKSDRAKSFYEKYGFKLFPDNTMMLWLRIADARNATQRLTVPC
ncbi:N-acetyltransferase [Acidithiobacillus ferrooxidans]|uniref:GNAT family N-acetyltransferase n=1 Tax=Acidithiobacillus ferrooxidans TaxID=920 RepID=UPI001C07AD17|nr:GNAT family N-acetyltransferase [Acidithiobacillus ferrooxidans]MBU2774330.1 N-acetyltransferase [Acidithiobacillus ferrooxidans]